MIAMLIGTVVEKLDQSIILLVAGIGYEVSVSSALLSTLSPQSPVTLYTYLAIRENAQELYGFRSARELFFFKRLLTINGIGPKTALHILSLGTVEELAGAITRGDLGYLTKVSGIGKKTAERIMVELKGKLGAIVAQTDGAAAVETDEVGAVMDALVGLGYSMDEARRAAIAACEKTQGSLQDQVKAALQQLGR